MDKILFCLSYCYLLGVVLLLVSKNQLSLPFISQLVDSGVPEQKTLSHSDARFLSYMQRSLNKIDQKSRLPQTDSPPPTPTGVSSKYTPIGPLTQLPVKTPDTAFVPPPPPPGSEPPAQSPVAPTPSPDNGYTLVGLFESGDRSAGLFSLNGVVVRVSLGEPIAATGWLLESVTAQQAVIAKQGERRLLTIGHKF